MSVTVHNRNWADVRVYVVAGEARHRLGLVPAFSTATYHVPRVIPMPSELRFIAVPMAHGEAQATTPMSVSSGSAVVVTLENVGAFSKLVVQR